MPYEFECNFDGCKCNSNENWKTNKCRCEWKNPEEHYACQKDYIWNPHTCSCENGKRLVSTIDGSMIMCA